MKPERRPREIGRIVELVQKNYCNARWTLRGAELRQFVRFAREFQRKNCAVVTQQEAQRGESDATHRENRPTREAQARQQSGL
ncbi:hypothetical protein VARIO8X_150146 [Burkholderiales bacterium 8X]|nr:hypothetical protein VARIO8X_150146 [Burkholderiales bacterium 8X]